MDDDRDLQDFSGRCRLFPLPQVVLFPHAILPLHIFEPRYRQMTEHALAGDRLVTIVQLLTSTTPTAQALGSPPIAEVGCLGRVLQHERLPDGRFNFLLLGRKRVRLRREVDTDSLYRVAEAEILDDVDDDQPAERRRAELVTLFRDAFGRRHKIDPDLSEILEQPLPLGVLTDIVAHALGLPPELKQTLLAETEVARRAETLLGLLRQLVSRPREPSPPSWGFPPPFSNN